MNTETIIAELERFQKRFAGGDSKTIDAAVTSLRSLVASNATLRNQRNESIERGGFDPEFGGYAVGDTEEDAIVTLAKARGFRLWNEEEVQP